MEVFRYGHIALSLLLVNLLFVSTVFCGECCNSYQDLAGDTHDAQWCSDYCCYDGKTFGFTLTCCDHEVMRAPEKWRDSFCVAWWASHVYVPILVSIALVIGCVGCCCCCCFGCCRRQRDPVIVHTQAGSAGPSLVVQQQQQQSSMMNPYHAGYNQ